MREFFREIVHALEAGQPAELVSVAASEGSTPRGAGAMMAVFPGGRATGTIGRGRGEFEGQGVAAGPPGGQAMADVPLRSTSNWLKPALLAA